jgi:2-aminomuconate deaminase
VSDELARPRGTFPHVRVAGSHVFVSGTSARRPDDTIEGAEVDARGEVHLDAAVQTHAVLTNVEKVLGTIGLDRGDLVDVTSFLVDMEHFGPYNEVWADFFAGYEPPARTTVAVRQLPHPHLLLEIKAVALMRGEPT